MSARVEAKEKEMRGRGLGVGEGKSTNTRTLARRGDRHTRRRGGLCGGTDRAPERAPCPAIDRQVSADDKTTHSSLAVCTHPGAGNGFFVFFLTSEGAGERRGSQMVVYLVPPSKVDRCDAFFLSVCTAPGVGEGSWRHRRKLVRATSRGVFVWRGRNSEERNAEMRASRCERAKKATRTSRGGTSSSRSIEFSRSLSTFSRDDPSHSPATQRPIRDTHAPLDARRLALLFRA